MTHHIDCPNCQQHLDIEVPDPVREPAVVRRVLEPVEIVMSSRTIFNLTLGVLFSLLVIGVIVVVGLFFFGAALSGL